MLKSLTRALLAHLALRHGRLVGLYRRFVRPDGYAWTRYLKRHGGFHAIGEGCAIQMNVTVTDPPHVRIGDNVHLTGCTLFGHDGTVSMVKQAFAIRADAVGKIDIRDNVFVGHQAIVMPGVTIGPNAIVAAGAVVTRDVPPNSVVAGVPARVVGRLDAYVAKLQRRTAQMPWCDHPQLAPDYLGPAAPELTEARVRQFFGAERPHSEDFPSVDSSATVRAGAHALIRE